MAIRSTRYQTHPPTSAELAGGDRGLGQAMLVATGSDHPGILDDIGQYLADRGATIEAVRVSNLRGRFALLVLVSGEEPALKRLSADLHVLAERTGVRASIEAPDDPATGAAASTRFRLTANGDQHTDESSTLRQTSNLLRVLNVNMIDVETQRTASGGFEMGLELDVPRDVPVGKLRELLGQLFNREHVHWELSAELAE